MSVSDSINHLTKEVKSNATVYKNRKQKLPQIGPGKRYKIKRKHVYTLLEVGTEAHKLVNSFGSKEFIFYGKCISKQQHGIWRVKLDLLPMSDSEVMAVCKHILMVIPSAEIGNRQK